VSPTYTAPLQNTCLPTFLPQPIAHSSLLILARSLVLQGHHPPPTNARHPHGKGCLTPPPRSVRRSSANPRHFARDHNPISTHSHTPSYPFHFLLPTLLFAFYCLSYTRPHPSSPRLTRFFAEPASNSNKNVALPLPDLTMFTSGAGVSHLLPSHTRVTTVIISVAGFRVAAACRRGHAGCPCRAS